jgi:hypothetical protein
MNMIRLATGLATLALLTTSFTPSATAQTLGPADAGGTWYFFVALDGQPPCQCVEITRFNTNGTITDAANDHFSGPFWGIWTQTAYHQISVTGVQNNINADGTAGGVYLTTFTMTISPAGDQASGTGTLQLLDNTGAVTFSDTFSFKGNKLKIP